MCIKQTKPAMGTRRLFICILLYSIVQHSHASSVLLKSLQPHASVKMQFGAEHSPSPCNVNALESAKIDGETHLGIEVPRGSDHRNILLHKIGTYLTVVMKALAKTVEPPNSQDGSSTHLDFHVNAEFKEPEGHMTITDKHRPGDIVLHTSWAGESCPIVETHAHPIIQNSIQHAVSPTPHDCEQNSPSNPPYSDIQHYPLVPPPHYAAQHNFPRPTHPTSHFHSHATSTHHEDHSPHPLNPHLYFPEVHRNGEQSNGPEEEEVLHRIGSILGSQNGVHGNFLGPTTGGLLSGVGHILGPGNGGLLTGIGGILGPTDAGILSGSGNILRSVNEGLLSEVGNIPRPGSEAAFPGIGNILEPTNTDLIYQNGDLLGETDGNLLSGVGNILGLNNGGLLSGIGGLLGSDGGGLLSGDGNILQLDLSLPVLQPYPPSSTVLFQPANSQPIENGIDFSTLPNGADPSNFGLLPGSSNVIGTTIGGLLPASANRLGPVDGDLLSGIGNILEPTNNGLLPGTDTITGSNDGGLLSGGGNILRLELSLPGSQPPLGFPSAIPNPLSPFNANQGIGLPSGSGDGNVLEPPNTGLLSSPGNLIGPVGGGLLSGIGEILGQTTDGLLSGIGNILGSVDGNSLLGSGNILHLDLSIPGSQTFPSPPNVVPIPPSSFPINQGSGPVLFPNIAQQDDVGELAGARNTLGNIFQTVNGGVLPATGNIRGPVNGGLLPQVGNTVEGGNVGSLLGTGNIIGPIDEGLLSGIGNILQVDLSIPGSQSYSMPPYVDPYLLNQENGLPLAPNNAGPGGGNPFPGNGNFPGLQNGGLLSGIGNILGQVNNGQISGIGNTLGLVGGGLPGSGNILDLQLSIPGTSTIPNIAQLGGGLLSGGGNNLVPGNGGTLSGITNILGSPSEGLFPGNNLGTITGGLLSSAGNILGSDERSILSDYGNGFGQADSGVFSGIGSSGPVVGGYNAADPIYKNFKPASHSNNVHTVEPIKPHIPSDNVHMRTTSHTGYSKLSDIPISHMESRRATASSSDKNRISKTENIKATKFHPSNGISHLEVINSNTLVDSRSSPEVLNQISNNDHSYQHSIVSTSKHRANEYKIHHSENGSPLKYLHHNQISENKDRSLEGPVESRNINSQHISSRHQHGFDDRTSRKEDDDEHKNISDLVEAHDHHGRLEKSRYLPLGNIPNLVNVLKNSESEMVYNKSVDFPQKNINIAENSHVKKSTLDKEPISAPMVSLSQEKDSVLELRSERKLDEIIEPVIDGKYNEERYNHPHISHNDINSMVSDDLKAENIHKNTDLEQSVLPQISQTSFPKYGLDFSENEPLDNVKHYVLGNKDAPSTSGVDKESFNTNPVAMIILSEKNKETLLENITRETKPENKSYIHSPFHFNTTSETRDMGNVKDQAISKDKHTTVKYISKATNILTTDAAMPENYEGKISSSKVISEPSSDIGASAFDAITSTSKYTEALNNQTYVSPLINSGNHEPLILGTSVLNVSDLWKSDTTNKESPTHKEVVLRQPNLVAQKNVQEDTDRGGENRATHNMYIQQYKASPLGNHERSFQTTPIYSESPRETNSNSYEREVNAQKYASNLKYKPELTPQSNLKQHLENEEHTFESLAQHREAHSQLNSQYIVQNHSKALNQYTRNSTNPSRKVETHPQQADHTDQIHSALEHRQKETTSYSSEHNRESHSTSAYNNLQSHSYSLHRDVESQPNLSDMYESQLTSHYHDMSEPNIPNQKHEIISISAHRNIDHQSLPQEAHSALHTEQKQENHPLSTHDEAEPRSYLLREENKYQLTLPDNKNESQSKSEIHDVERLSHSPLSEFESEKSDHKQEPQLLPEHRKAETRLYLPEQRHGSEAILANRNVKSQLHSLHNDGESRPYLPDSKNNLQFPSSINEDEQNSHIPKQTLDSTPYHEVQHHSYSPHQAEIQPHSMNHDSTPQITYSKLEPQYTTPSHVPQSEVFDVVPNSPQEESGPHSYLVYKSEFLYTPPHREVDTQPYPHKILHANEPFKSLTTISDFPITSSRMQPPYLDETQSVTPHLESDTAVNLRGQTETHSTFHKTDISKTSTSHDREPHISLVEPHDTYNIHPYAHSHQEGDSYLPHNVERYLSHEVETFSSGKKEIGSYLAHGIDSNSQPYRELKEYRSLNNDDPHYTQKKEESHLMSKNNNEFNPSNRQIETHLLYHDTKPNIPPHHEVETIPQYKKKFSSTTHLETEVPPTPRQEMLEYSAKESNMKSPPLFSAFKQNSEPDAAQESHKSLQPEMIPYYKSMPSLPSHYVDESSTPLQQEVEHHKQSERDVTFQKSSLNYLGDPTTSVHYDVEPEQSQYDGHSQKSLHKNNELSLRKSSPSLDHDLQPHNPIFHEVSPEKKSYNSEPHKILYIKEDHDEKLKSDSYKSSYETLLSPSTSKQVSEHAITFPQKTGSQMSPHLEIDPEKLPHHKSVTSYHEVETHEPTQIETLPPTESQHGVINSISRPLTTLHDAIQPQTHLKYDSQTPHPNNMYPTLSHNVGEPPTAVNHNIKTQETATNYVDPIKSSDFNVMLPDKLHLEVEPAVLPRYADRSDIVSEIGAESHVPSHHKTVSDIRISQGSDSSFSSHNDIALHKLSQPEIDSLTSVPHKVVHPIYVTEPPALSHHHLLSYKPQWDVDTQSHHNTEVPITLYQASEGSILPYPMSKFPISTHNTESVMTDTNLNQSKDLSKALAIGFAENNALYDSNSGIVEALFKGDDSMRPRIICLTDQRDNLELLRSLKDDITKLKQKLNCE